jgi:predicted esterase
MIDKLNLCNDRKFKEFNFNSSAIYSLPENKIPFFVLLHSLGKNEKYISKFSEILPKNAFILSIRGKFDWKVDGENSFAWFDIKGPFIENFCKEDDILTSANYIEKIINEVKNEFTNLDDPIIIGFSQGGIIGLTIAIEELFPVKAVYCHCGFYETKLNTGKDKIKTKILITNGSNDPVIPLDWYHKTYNILSSKCDNLICEIIDCGHEMNEKAVLSFLFWLKTLLNY